MSVHMPQDMNMQIEFFNLFTQMKIVFERIEEQLERIADGIEEQNKFIPVCEESKDHEKDYLVDIIDDMQKEVSENRARVNKFFDKYIVENHISLFEESWQSRYKILSQMWAEYKKKKERNDTHK